MIALAAVAAAGLLAAHPEARSEWWYYTGHLRRAGHELGFELTFFRFRLPDGEDLDAAHFAVTDVAGNRFVFDEKLHRPFPGIAAASPSRLDVYTEDWFAREEHGAHHLAARSFAAAIDLRLEPAAPLVENGEGGISRKGAGPDEYSHYVTIPRLRVTGTEWDGASRAQVTGEAWFDHEWGPGGLSPDLAGWDWFACQLSDGGELMLYRLRLRGGADSPFSSGTWIPPDGGPRHLGSQDFGVIATGRWASPKSGATYPSGWRISVPALGVQLSVAPKLADQELVTSRSTRVTYWEGACAVAGTAQGRAVSGNAYVELTGYAGRDLPSPR